MPKELEKLRELFYKEWLNKPFTYEEFADWWLEKIPKLFQERDKLLVEKVKDISDREVDGSWLPDGMYAYYESDLDAIINNIEPYKI